MYIYGMHVCVCVCLFVYINLCVCERKLIPVPSVHFE